MKRTTQHGPESEFHIEIVVCVDQFAFVQDVMDSFWYYNPGQKNGHLFLEIIRLCFFISLHLLVPRLVKCPLFRALSHYSELGNSGHNFEGFLVVSLLRLLKFDIDNKN